MKFSAVMFVSASMLGGGVQASDPCEGFSRDVRIERQLFADTAREVVAGVSEQASPTLGTARLFLVTLSSQKLVHFAAGPGGRGSADDAHAGLTTLKVQAAGRYRISLDARAWVDMVAGGQFIPPAGYEGRPDCHAPHKIVEFDLPAGVVLIQVSAAQPDKLRLAITAVPPDGR